jgi:hypothetical protein
MPFNLTPPTLYTKKNVLTINPMMRVKLRTITCEDGSDQEAGVPAAAQQQRLK